MKSKVFIVALLVAVLVSTGSCQDRHHHHDEDENWPIFISKIELLWKSTTVPSTANGMSQDTAQFTTEMVMQNGTFVEEVKDTFRASLALLIGAPIFGILLLCCCCYCCCKCCSVCCEGEEKGNVIVMQQNNAPAPAAPQPQTHIIVQQQPMYQQAPYAMQPPPQWSPHAPQFPTANAAYDNPNYGAPPSAPPQYAPKY